VGITAHMCAIGPIVAFSTTLLLKVEELTNGTFPISPFVGSFIMTFTNLFSAGIGPLAAKWFGRKTIMLAGSFFMSLTHLIIGIAITMEQYGVCFAFIIVFICIWQTTHGNINFVYFAEVCVDQANGLALGGMFGTMIIMAFLVSFLIDSSLGMAGTFFLYAGTSFVGVIYNLLFMKETKGLSPSQLSVLYAPNMPENKVQSEVEIGEK
jgi:hypothetical protein